ncbi:MAG: RagB/SusD family nutrient uptake outer membrane protein, partial [Paludibacter sp.]|nr:RagB/SusD family nutrient uptake outer membrane protein [Paludibacter sp.]
ERRIEFAFENKRFFDLRRNLLPLNEPIKGVQIVQTAAGFVYSGTNPAGAGVVVEERKLDDPKHYYLPIPYDKIVTNKNLIQNKGW